MTYLLCDWRYNERTALQTELVPARWRHAAQNIVCKIGLAAIYCVSGLTRESTFLKLNDREANSLHFFSPADPLILWISLILESEPRGVCC